jgi:hypothetical protein
MIERPGRDQISDHCRQSLGFGGVDTDNYPLLADWIFRQAPDVCGYPIRVIRQPAGCQPPLPDPLQLRSGSTSLHC